MKSHSLETYRMFGKINATSRLMYAYMPQMVQKPTRSDEAEADWHYTQFLNLSDRQQEIDPYLEERLWHYFSWYWRCRFRGAVGGIVGDD